MPIEFQDTPDSEAFHLPLPGLFADVESGSGCIRLTDEFDECDVISQLRIVQDWQRDLQEVRQANLARLFRSRFATLAVSRAEQIARFNRYCEQQGLDCPPDLATGLIEGALWGYTSTTQ